METETKRKPGRPRKYPKPMEPVEPAKPKRQRQPNQKIIITEDELNNSALSYDELYNEKVHQRRLLRLREWYARAKESDPIKHNERLQQANLKYKNNYIEKYGEQAYKDLCALYKLRFREKQLIAKIQNID